MNAKDIEKMIGICEEKIAKKWENVGISFYVFFKNKNDQKELLFEVAKWWIYDLGLDHFEKAIKIRAFLQDMLSKKDRL